MGFDFDAINWKPENRARTVAMSLSKNTAIFHRLPNGLFGLREWYPDAIEKRKGKKGGASNGDAEPAEEDQDDDGNEAASE